VATDYLDYLQLANRIRELRTYGRPLTREASGYLDDQIRILALEINKAWDEQVNRRKGQS
jgi:hypothetical protein